MSHKLDMNAGRESHGRVVPAKCPNKGGNLSPAEGMEERRPTKENAGHLAASRMQSWEHAFSSPSLGFEKRFVRFCLYGLAR